MSEGSRITFPEFSGSRIYMRPFSPSIGLPDDLKQWQSIVDLMMDGLSAEIAYLMVDESIAYEGQTHRRGGVHIDGFWNPGLSMHGGISPPSHIGNPLGHSGRPSGHSSRPTTRGHNATPSPAHGPTRGSHCKSSLGAEFIVLSSNVIGCAAYLGTYDHTEWLNGDRSSVDVSAMDRVILEPNQIYRGDTESFLHESIPIFQTCLRTVVRLNVPIG
jgi:hypothetical protein